MHNLKEYHDSLKRYAEECWGWYDSLPAEIKANIVPPPPHDPPPPPPPERDDTQDS